MEAKDIWKVVTYIKAVYPKSYERFSEEDFKNMAGAYFDMLGQYSIDEALAGVKAYVANDTKGFPPVPGQIIDKIKDLKEAVNPSTRALTPLEAWGMVYKAISRATYYAEEEFDRFPETIKKAVGNPANLREMARMDIDTVNSVEQSHFIRQYTIEVQREREMEKTPVKITNLIQQASNKMIEGN